MKKGIVLQSLISLLAVSCSVQEIDVKETPILDGNVFYASLESHSAPGTKVYVDENVKVLWDAEDRISIFNMTTLNQAYLFMGETGENAGYFDQDLDTEVLGTENPLGLICAVYPYQGSTRISESGVLTLTLPANQTYREGSFGPGANTMVSVTDDNMLQFKNVGGYLVLKLYGEGVSVSSITLVGNHPDQEKLSGEATWEPVVGGVPAVTMAPGASSSIKLTCPDPVALGANEEESVAFWMVVPPTHFSNGFKLYVEDSAHNGFVKDTRKDLSVVRNGVLRISPFEVIPHGDGLHIDDVYPHESSLVHKTTVNESACTITVTMPTVTDFSQFVFDYDFVGTTLKVGDQVIESGVTPIDATNPVDLWVFDEQGGGKNYTLTVRNTGLPVVRITTVGFSREEIENDKEHETWRPTKDEKDYSATFRVEKYNGDLDCEVSTQIKGRGNASWGYNKRPYALKFKLPKGVDGVEVLGMPAHKRWILLANWKDRTLLRNDAAFWLSQQVSDVIQSPSFPYTVHGQFVELVFNGEYRGNYYLCEQIKIDNNRLPINEFDESDPSGGYLLEIDNNYDETYKFLSGFYKSGRTTKGLKYMFKDPDEDLPDEAFTYVKNYIQTMEDYIKKIPNNITNYRNNKTDANYGYRGYLDMDSAIWFMFINELTGNGDFFNTDGSVNDKWYGPHSTYLYKDRDVVDEETGTTTRSKLFMGPVWDFDYKTFISVLTTTGWNGRITTEDRSHKWVGANQQNYYYYYLCKDPAFKERMLALWAQFRQIVTPGTFNAYIDRMATSISLSEEFNTEKWGNNNTQQDQGQNGDNTLSYQAAVNLMKQAFQEKLEWMDANLQSLNQ